MEAQKQIECPKCHSYKTKHFSGKYLTIYCGIIAIIVGFFLSFFLIGFPIIVLGIVLLGASAFVPDDGKMRCGSCNFVFHQTPHKSV